jgi:hypothetical protein
MPGRVTFQPRRGKSATAFGGGSNTAVKKTITKAQRTYRKPTNKTKALVNRMAIMTLSKQVNQLQRSKLGAFQTCRLRTGFQPTWAEPTNNPVIFCINDFNNSYVTNVGAPLYRGNAASFAKIGNFAQVVNSPSSADAVDYFYKEENNQASKILYAPVNTSFQIQCKRNMATGDVPIWIRIDIVKQKKVVNNLVRKLQLPDSVVGLGRMALQNTSYRNKYNKEFITIIQTKYLQLNNPDESLKEVFAQANFLVKFNPKVPIRTDSEADGSVNNENDFYNNVNPLEQVWCIMNFGSNTVNDMDINILKTDRWYDQHGTD